MIDHCLTCHGPFTRDFDQTWKRLCLPCWRRAKGAAPSPAAAATPSAPLEPSRIRQLLQLVHPDKHAGSALANEVTQWLLDLRRAAR